MYVLQLPLWGFQNQSDCRRQEGRDDSPFVLAPFAVVLVKYPDKKQPRGERVCFRSQFEVTAGKPRLQELEAPNHIQLSVQRGKKNAHLPTPPTGSLGFHQSRVQSMKCPPQSTQSRYPPPTEQCPRAHPTETLSPGSSRLHQVDG